VADSAQIRADFWVFVPIFGDFYEFFGRNRGEFLEPNSPQRELAPIEIIGFSDFGDPANLGSFCKKHLFLDDLCLIGSLAMAGNACAVLCVFTKQLGRPPADRPDKTNCSTRRGIKPPRESR
jgi:hypothetical protein